MELIRQVIALRPDDAEAHNNLGIALSDQGKLKAAVAAHRKALEFKPDYAEAHNNLGVALKNQDKLEAAVAAHRKALEFKPDDAEAHNNLGAALKKQGKLEAAVAAYRKALAFKPDYAEAHNNLGVALKSQGKLDAAAAACHRALALRPNYAKAHNNLGILLADLGRLEEAAASCRKALAIKPDYVKAHSNLGVVLVGQGRLQEAVTAYRKAVELKPDFAEARNNLGLVLKDQGRLEEAVAALRNTLELKPDYAEAHSNLIFVMNYDPRFSQKDICAESRRWDENHAAPRGGRQRAYANSRNPDRRLRVGYVSPGFREHAVSYFSEPLIAAHDRRSFEVFCYAQVMTPDDKTSRFRDLADSWRSTVGATDAAVAERIREDGIDILVDLSGHTGNSRLLVFAERPAPVQVTWLGHPNTTGLSAMDYRLTDEIADPEGAADTLYTETLVRLPNGFLCFAPAANAPEIGELPALTNGHVTFGSFNNLPKVAPEVVETWARILELVPGSRLLIKTRPLADGQTRNRYLELFVARGIEGGRIELCSWIASRSGHLGAYNRIDNGLDPFPYNGTTTTCEALWMGIPVVTLRGYRHSSRVGASILTRVALKELIAETKDAYVEKAVSLANAPDRLSELHKDLRNLMQGSPLCDSGAFTRDVEAAYREMWRRWCNTATEENGCR